MRVNKKKKGKKMNKEKGPEKNVKKSNQRIEEGLADASEAIRTLERVLDEIGNGNGNVEQSEDAEQNENEEPETIRSISDLVKVVPEILADYAENIRGQAKILRSLIL